MLINSIIRSMFDKIDKLSSEMEIIVKSGEKLAGSGQTCLRKSRGASPVFRLKAREKVN
jgi:hypothetical protein